MTLWGSDGQTVVMVRGKMKHVPETFEFDGRTYRTTSFLPSQKRSDMPAPGTLPPTEPEG